MELVYQFNQITLDTDQYRLCQADALVSVEPLIFDLLGYLIENRNRVVSCDELFENLWIGKVVTVSTTGMSPQNFLYNTGRNA